MNINIEDNIIGILLKNNISDDDIKYYIFDIYNISDINFYKDISEDNLLKDYYLYLNNDMLVFDEIND